MTCQQCTFNSLDSYFLNTDTMSVNVGYLNDQIYMQLDIVWRNENEGDGKSRLHHALMNKRRKSQSIIWEAFLDFANSAVQEEYGINYQATSEQLKKYMQRYKLTYDHLHPVLAEVESLRKDYIADKQRQQNLQ